MPKCSSSPLNCLQIPPSPIKIDNEKRGHIKNKSIFMNMAKWISKKLKYLNLKKQICKFSSFVDFIWSIDFLLLRTNLTKLMFWIRPCLFLFMPTNNWSWAVKGFPWKKSFWQKNAFFYEKGNCYLMHFFGGNEK